MSNPIVHIELGKDNPITLRFQLRDTPLAQYWLKKWHCSRPYPLDDPARFYGFNSVIEEVARAEQEIKQCIDTINAFKPIIERQFTTVHDQDCLNYMHNIFEKYHGLLDQQHHDFWQQAPESVRRALSRLNVSVHRCETAVAPPQPRMVCTWYGLPKTDTLSIAEMQQYGELAPAFGTLCFCYVEIGKTLEDLTHDLDNYIADDAFKPFNFYSVDFVVRFVDTDPATIKNKLQTMEKYYQQHWQFFNDRKLSNFNDPRLLPLRFPFADLIPDRPNSLLLELIRQNQYVNKVYIQ